MSIDRDQCKCCNRYLPDGAHYAWFGGPYCSKECYDTLFDNCDECSTRHMTVVGNMRTYNEKLCAACRTVKHNITTQTIVMKFPRRRA